MARKDFIGNAVAVAQVVSLTPASVSSGSTFGYKINEKSVSYTSSPGTVSDAVTGFVAAWNASTVPEFAEVTASAGPANAYVLLTADEPGRDFGGATFIGGSGTPTFTKATVTANAGPNDWNSAANWMTDGDITVNGKPSSGDDVYIGPETPQILYGLDQSAVALSSLYVLNGRSNSIGLPYWSNSQAGSYREHRQRALKIGSSLVQIGSNDNLTSLGNLPSFIKIHLVGDGAISVFGTGSPTFPAGYCLELSGGDSATTVGITHGYVSLSPSLDEPFELAALIIGQDATGNPRGPEVLCGPGTTLGAVLKHGGTLRTFCNYTSGINHRGEWIHRAGTEGDLTIRSGSAYRSYSPGTPSKINLWAGGVVDWNGLPVARTCDEVNFFACGPHAPEWLDNTNQVDITDANYILGV